MYILGCHLVDLIVYLMGEPQKITSFLHHSGFDGVDVEDNNLAVLEYPNALVRIFISCVEINGNGRRQFVVAGQKGTVNIMPIENPCHMTYSNREIAKITHDDMHIVEDVEQTSPDTRYDCMMQDFYEYIQGTKENPFTYEHDFLVQKVLDKIVGGVCFRGKNID
jgi:predicted dehydrogenase